MTKFNALHTDSSIYQSEFFRDPPFQDGRESFPWANLISTLNKNPKVRVFFFDINRDHDVLPYRDSLMAMNIKKQFNIHPAWKLITLSGNYHNRISDPNSMASVLKRNVSGKVCSLDIRYKEGSANANFGRGLEVKPLGSYSSVYCSTAGFERYLLLYPPNTDYDFNGIYFTKYITAAKMVSTK